MVGVTSGGGTHVGPGYRVAWTGLSGTSLATDYVGVSVYPHLTTSPTLIYGTLFCNGAAADDLLLGFDDDFLPVSIVIVDGYVAPGGLVDIVLTHLDASSTVIETGTLVSELWDPTGMAWILPWNYYRNLPTYTPPVLFTIEAAVRKNLPSLP